MKLHSLLEFHEIFSSHFILKLCAHGNSFMSHRIAAYADDGRLRNNIFLRESLSRPEIARVCLNLLRI